MAEADKAPKLEELVREHVFGLWGVPGLIAIAVVGALFYVWTNWEKVAAWPGVSSLVARARRKALPQTDARRYSVAVATLEDDPEGDHKRLIVTLLRDFEGVEVLSFDRIISVKGSNPDDLERKGHEQARAYLAESGADVLVWGHILRHGVETKPALYVTAAAGRDGRARQYTFESGPEFRLCDMFWKELSDVLGLVICTQAAQFNAERGQYVADRLQPFIARVQRLFITGDGRLIGEARASTKLVLAGALGTFGEQSGRLEALGTAIEAYQEVLKEWARERVPLDWAMTQNNLGATLMTLGQREGGTARLKAAVAAYEQALRERTREKVPLHWAMTQNNLGNALASLGERESGTARLEAAVAAYEEALKEWTREKVPLNWAMAQNNRGAALMTLGQREGGTARLKAAVAAYEQALRERTREKVPLHWAMTQSNLGSALTLLGERESGTAQLKAAVAAYEEAVRVFDEAGASHFRDGTKSNLQRAKTELAKHREE